MVYEIVYFCKRPFNWLSCDGCGFNFGSYKTLYIIRALKILQGVGRVQVSFLSRGHFKIRTLNGGMKISI